MLQPELTAGCVDISAKLSADSSIHAVFLKSTAKFFCILSIRCRKSRFLNGIQKDQIHVAGSILHLTAEKSAECLRTLNRIVLPCDKSILKGYSSAGGIEIISAGIHQLSDAPFAIYGHKRGSNVVVIRMKGDRQRYRKTFIRKSTYAGHKSTGGHGDMAKSYIRATLRTYEAKEFHRIIIVIKRLADSHHYDSVHTLATISCGYEHLTKDLRCGEIADSAAKGGCTK